MRSALMRDRANFKQHFWCIVHTKGNRCLLRRAFTRRRDARKAFKIFPPGKGVGMFLIHIKPKKRSDANAAA